ncbi:DNA helicase/exodeoxyribonuclease V, gamma subunit [Alkalispirochaeta americana]|uniref:RecBCD enzyme subunit RecC n=1 Tax=Alkalispirochaeta americana TaxID=159291 RepID=A0A1N6PCE2_9SPIO|nr:exodeoxyribonuclease V subunit gamma [Alkalispirochaeta americana]SIQ01929.1 DNA helicase/exodeoxyribonuclease V, gamma subunit [Alkalispirochaeta americana]
MIKKDPATPSPPSPEYPWRGISPGFHVIHGNLLEDLRDLMVQWISEAPLPPLEPETILVQSNGISQWLKFALAESGVAMGLEITLPARLQWRLYRATPGNEAVPAISPYDKELLVWRILRILPELLPDPAFTELQRFLADPADLLRRYELALRIADLLDQYQVYRADWLSAWQEGRLEGPEVFPEEHHWQARLWQRLCEDMPLELHGTDRATIHQRCLDYLRTCREAPQGLPPRIIAFGMSTLTAPVIEALQAASRFSQVLLFVHNPCRYHWTEIGEPRGILTRQRRRSRPGRDSLQEEDLHFHGHPLLISWGMQGRDYIGLLDSLDETGQSEVFRSPGESCLLHQLQEDIFELRSLEETRERWQDPLSIPDKSLTFHNAHSALREIEILHDNLLEAFEEDPDLEPRDVMVMVPDITSYAPLVSAVFGQHSRDDLRRIPYTISDQTLRDTDPVVSALETLLDISSSRATLEEILGLLETPSLREAFGLNEEDLSILEQWACEAGIRWGIDGAHREQFDIPHRIEQNTWRFGLRRMLLGYATGERSLWQGIAGFEGVAGLEAESLGKLARLIERLDRFRKDISTPRPPQEWSELLRGLLEDFFRPRQPREEETLEALGRALHLWEAACRQGGFQEEIPLTVVRQGWMERLDTPGLTQRFFAGAVNFATLMPMRAVPFKMICLLGMNDKEYPRQQQPLGFDLMQLRGNTRTGDRSRREDDRYLFLEALLSARKRLYISWAGRSIQDNSLRSPSILVSRLRDHLDRGWTSPTPAESPEPSPGVSASLTREYPLQPFSNAYRDPGTELFTYAREWWHPPKEEKPLPSLLFRSGEARTPSLRDLQQLLRLPCQVYFSEGLDVTSFGHDTKELPQEEPFSAIGLDRWHLQQELIEDILLDPGKTPQEHFNRLVLAGKTPVPPFHRSLEEACLADGEDMISRYRQELPSEESDLLPGSIRARITLGRGQVILEEEIFPVFTMDGGLLKRLILTPTRLTNSKGPETERLRREKLLSYWPGHLAANAAGEAMTTTVAGLHTTVTLHPLPPEEACRYLEDLFELWHEATAQPLPATPATAFAWFSLDCSCDSTGSPLWDETLLKRIKTQQKTSLDHEYNQSTRLQRIWSSWQEIWQAPAFAETARRLYFPLYHHTSSQPPAGSPAKSPAKLPAKEKRPR